MVTKTNAWSSLRARSDRSLAKSTAAVWAHVVKDMLYAVSTECTFVSANTGLGRLGRQVLVAVLAVWS